LNDHSLKNLFYKDILEADYSIEERDAAMEEGIAVSHGDSWGFLQVVVVVFGRTCSTEGVRPDGCHVVPTDLSFFFEVGNVGGRRYICKGTVIAWHRRIFWQLFSGSDYEVQSTV